MASSLRVLTRRAIANCVRTSTTAPTSTTVRSRLLLKTSHVSYGRSLHICASRAAASTTPSVLPEEQLDIENHEHDPTWRHPRHGFAVADYPRMVYLAVPRQTTESDLKALLSQAGFPDAQITMFYELETGCSACFCYLKLSDENQVTAAVSALSRFTLFGVDINAEKYDASKFPDWQQPSVFTGWMPSPSSDLQDRVVRPLITSPPLLLRPLIAEQWVMFQNLPPIDLKRKEGRFEIVHELYKKLYKYDVLGITTIRDRPSRTNGWSCKVQFGSREEAQAARKAHVEAETFMGRPARAKIFRPGPNVQKFLWEYQQSLPKETPPGQVSGLLEKRYREMVHQEKKYLQRGDHPTPKSAVGLKAESST